MFIAILVTVLLIILIFVMYGGYRLLNGDPFFPWDSKKEIKTPVGTQGDRPDPDTSATGTCEFEGEDTFNQKVFSYNGDLVLPDTKVDCSQCNQYLVKQDTGCLPLGFDKNERDKVCVAGILSTEGTWGVPPIKTCPFENKPGKKLNQ
jgi:hypothetical protein